MIDGHLRSGREAISGGSFRRDATFTVKLSIARLPLDARRSVRVGRHSPVDGHRALGAWRPQRQPPSFLSGDGTPLRERRHLETCVSVRHTLACSRRVGAFSRYTSVARRIPC